MRLIFCFLILINLIQESLSQIANNTLKGLIVFHRHGARLPAVEDYYKEDWPQDLIRGDLTQKGIQQLLKVGKTIRRKYVDEMKFLPKVYDPTIFKVRIAQLSRCMLSLLSMFNGLYPDIYQREHLTRQTILQPKKKFPFSLNLSEHEQRDLTFRAQSAKNCKLMDHIYNRRRNEDKFEQIYDFFLNHPVMNSTLTKLEQYRQKRNGKPLNVTGMYYIKEVYDSYLCNKIQGNPVPEWNKTEIKLLQLNYETFFYRYFGFREARKMTSSKFFKEVFEFFQNIVKHPDNPEKLFIFSGTKTNIAIILSNLLVKHQILSLGTEKVPPLSATLFIELWEKSHLPHLPADNRFFIKFYYGKKELEILACRNRRRCTWKEFKILFKTRIIPNLESFCNAVQEDVQG